jgi:hypothetical protein
VIESFSAWALRRKVAFGLVQRQSGNPERDLECERITTRRLVLHNKAARSSFLCGPDIDSMIRSACASGYDFLFLLAPGSFFRGKPRLVSPLETLIEHGFFVAGHVLDRGASYYTLHHQCVFVNLQTWAEIGCPGFGSADQGRRRLHRPLRSGENHHDDNTPTWIEPSGERAEYEATLPGWHFVHAALDARVPVISFGPEIRKRKGFLYPEDDQEYAARLGELDLQTVRWANSAWVMNTERLPETLQGIPPVGAIVSVASGLHTYRLLKRAGFDERTVVHYFDASGPTLEFKRWLLASWDGRDYAAAVATWLELNPDARLAGVYGSGLPDAIESYEAETGAPFENDWRRFRRLQHSFHHVDLLTCDRTRVLSLIERSSSSTVLWWSNVFHSLQTHTWISEEESAGIYRRWVETLQAHNPDLFVIWTDPGGRTVARKIRDIEPQVDHDLATNRYSPE